MWIVVAAAVLVGVLIAGMLLQSTPLPTATPTSAAPAPVSQGPGLPFTMPSNASSTGRWEVLSQEWSARGVTLRVRVSCDTGTVTYGFKAFPNSGMDVVDPSPGSRTPALSTGTLRPGETASGYIFLELPRGAATLILTTSAGRQISALPITA